MKKIGMGVLGVLVVGSVLIGGAGVDAAAKTKTAPATVIAAPEVVVAPTTTTTTTTTTTGGVYEKLQNDYLAKQKLLRKAAGF